MENGVFLTSPQSQAPAASCCSIFFVPHLRLLQLKAPSYFHHHHLWPSLTLTPKFSRKDSNADRNSFSEEEEKVEEEEEEESFTGNVKKKNKRNSKRKWWSNHQRPLLNKKRPAIVLDEAIDSIFIFRVFSSFGWFVPVIIISFLLSTGIKAFLMTFVLFIALSILFLAFEKLREMMQQKPVRKTRMWRKASSKYASRVQMEEGEGEEIQDTRREKMDAPSWMGSNNGPFYKRTQDVTNFAGWDFPDEATPVKGTSRMTNESEKTKDKKLNGNGRGVTSKLEKTKDEKLSGNRTGVTSKSERTEDEKSSGNGSGVTSKSERVGDEKISWKGRNDAPLLLRLLIGVFPIVGFWAKMFW